MDTHSTWDSKVMWWQAYLAALTGLSSAPKGSSHDIATCASEDANAALEAYRKRWGGEES